MAAIDPTARIEPEAVIGHKASIGPYASSVPMSKLGDGCNLWRMFMSLVTTTIGPRHRGLSIRFAGHTPPQSVKYRGGPTRLVIGADCEIREGVTVNTGTEDDRGVTEVGDRCWLMVGSHIGHDCKVRHDVIFATTWSWRPRDDRRFCGVRWPGSCASVRAHRRRRDGRRAKRRARRCDSLWPRPGSACRF